MSNLRSDARYWPLNVRSLGVLLVIGAAAGVLLITTGCSPVTEQPAQSPDAPQFAVKEASFERRADTNSGTSDTTAMTLVEELAGQVAIGKLAEQLDLLKDLPRGKNKKLTPEGQREKLSIVRKLRQSIEIGRTVKSADADVITVRARHADPEMAARIANGLVENYIGGISKEIVKRLTADSTFLAKRMSDCKAKLDEMQKKRIEFETEHRGSMPDKPGTMRDEIKKITAELKELKIQQKQINEKLALRQESKEKTSTTKSSTQPANAEALERAFATISRAIEQLELSHKKLEASMSDFVRLRAEYQETSDAITKQKKEIERWQAQYDTVQMKLAAEVARHRTRLTRVRRATSDR